MCVRCAGLLHSQRFLAAHFGGTRILGCSRRESFNKSSMVTGFGSSLVSSG
jgi:hypothetical protein